MHPAIFAAFCNIIEWFRVARTIDLLGWRRRNHSLPKWRSMEIAMITNKQYYTSEN